MNEIASDSSFNENFQLITAEKNALQIQAIFTKVLAEIPSVDSPNLFLKNGIKCSILKAIITLLDLNINPLASEILPEYKSLVLEINDVYVQLAPEIESNWIEECIAYGEKKAYHWDWKCFGSKELY
jgi:hypothetical protein